MSNYTKQDVLFQKRFGRFHAILIQKLYLMQVYKARGKRKCKCKRGVYPVALPSVRELPQCWKSPVKQQNSPNWRQFQAPSVCPQRERSCELNLTEFPLLFAVAIYFTHFSFKGRNTKSLLGRAGSILRNSLSDEIRAIINLAAYELNAISTFQLTSHTASPANFPHFLSN